ncbi:MAG: IS30 family transposase [Bacteroidia bacterium]|nr:IS30 family transposase [Bacteroidia bacterium]
MMGKNHQGAILVMTDRTSLHTRLVKLPSKDTQVVEKGIETVLEDLKNVMKHHTLTFDNDKAFALHQQIARKYGVKTYFTRPYCSQDKGTIENRIGTLRMFIPKKQTLTLLRKKC